MAAMAASSSGGRRQQQQQQQRPPPKSLGQEELRRLMREKQRETAGKKKKKIDSPFARYNVLGNLNCSLCNVPVKNELLWQTHALGKQHKEKLAGLKDLKQAVPGPISNPTSSLKRRTADADTSELKKVKGASDHPQTATSGLPTYFFGKIDEAERFSSEDPKQKLSSEDAKHSILVGDYEEEEEEEEEIVEKNKDNDCKSPLPIVQNAVSAIPQKAEAATALASDSLDRAAAAPLVSHSGSIQKAEIQEKIVERRENTAEALPEGFFDDPEVDAKVRKVDAPKDQMDKEWDEFQKAMRQVNTVSEAIVAEEDEEGRLDRQIGEIDEQIECFRRVEQLRDRQDVMKDKLKEAMRIRATHAKDDEDIGSDDEGELQDLLSQDWRAKGTLL